MIGKKIKISSGTSDSNLLVICFFLLQELTWDNCMIRTDNTNTTFKATAE
jgi:hypothetical protein